jgi:hypothetical protein
MSKRAGSTVVEVRAAMPSMSPALPALTAFLDAIGSALPYGGRRGVADLDPRLRRAA